ncbi:hypothetical protein MUG78_17760 [Gordonia alkaliphila]|uniref:hypothetical protein n=1 Tax=Gordonia alkaliphila TaxID=1053547 RepID=UPI001FF51356|nr:hypothetical protein [Gordonia alkaliphila]MCK0441248.1 hypothetical protein [Gordonia alkaliphila]
MATIIVSEIVEYDNEGTPILDNVPPDGMSEQEYEDRKAAAVAAGNSWVALRGDDILKIGTWSAVSSTPGCTVALMV